MVTTLIPPKTPSTDDGNKEPLRRSNETTTVEQRATVAKATYEYLRAIRDHDAATYPIYLQKARYLMTIVMVIVASMSYALTKIEWALAIGSNGHLAALFIIGISAALSLVAAFWCGIRCHHIRGSAVVGVSALKKTIDDNSFMQLEPEHFYRDVSLNLADTILKNRDADKKRAHWALVLNWTTLLGFIFGSVFVTYTIAGDVLNTETDARAPETQIMPIESDRSNQADSPNLAPSGDSDRPTIVEPSVHIQSDFRPNSPRAGEAHDKVPPASSNRSHNE